VLRRPTLRVRAVKFGAESVDSLEMSAIQAERVRTPASDVAVPRWISKSTAQFLTFVFVGSRLVNVAFVLLGRSKIIPFALNDAGPGAGGSWLSPWTFFDGRWYLSISGKGYEGFTSVFYPLLPNILKLAGSDPAHRALFGVIFSTICFALALPILFRLIESSHGERPARIACFITAFMPFSAVWGAVYTESLALLLLVTTWTYVRQGRWARAALPALLAGLTRNVGFVLAFAMGIEYLQQRGFGMRIPSGEPAAREDTKQRPLFVLAICALPAIASAGFMLWASRRFGAAGGLAAQEAYARGLAWPWWAVWKDATSVLSYLTIGKMLSLFGIGLAAVVSFQQRRRLRFGEHAIVWGVLAMHLLLARQNPPHTIGAARYLMTCFPFAIGLAVGIDRLPKRWATPLALILIGICALGAHTFGSGQFEIG
jgi:hypothetical protein